MCIGISRGVATPSPPGGCHPLTPARKMRTADADGGCGRRMRMRMRTADGGCGMRDAGCGKRMRDAGSGCGRRMRTADADAEFLFFLCIIEYIKKCLFVHIFQMRLFAVRIRRPHPPSASAARIHRPHPPSASAVRIHRPHPPSTFSGRGGVRGWQPPNSPPVDLLPHIQFLYYANRLYICQNVHS